MTDWTAVAAQRADDIELQMMLNSEEYAPELAGRLNEGLLDEWLFLVTDPYAGEILAERAWLRQGAAARIF